MSDEIEIRAADGTLARIARIGAEPVSWQIGGHDYLWSGDPEHWNRHAPWLFPVVGASSGGVVQVDGQPYPMAQHGFARDLPFTIVAQAEDGVTLRLTDNEATRKHYPFAFSLEITTKVVPSGLDFTISVVNSGSEPLPFALGFHPAFPWPFAGGERRAGGGYRVVFDEPEQARTPEIGEGGLLRFDTREIPLDGDTLPLDPELFKEALVFLDARSHGLRFVAPDGSAIVMRVEDFPHLAIWTKPTAPFLSLECWSGHADRTGFSGELRERESQTLLAPAATARFRVRLSLEPSAD